MPVKFGNQFCLSIGFPAIGEHLLSEASQHGVKVCISGSEHRRMILVDIIHFLEDYIILVLVGFISGLGKNFAVKIEPDSIKNARLMHIRQYGVKTAVYC